MNITSAKFKQDDQSEPMDNGPHLESDNDISIHLMQRIAEGDKHALSMLINQWKMPVINFVYRSIGNYEDAEEIALKAFSKIYDSATRYQPTAKFSTYLFLIAKRIMLTEIRKQKIRKVSPIDSSELTNFSSNEDAEKNKRSEIEEIFLTCLQRIPEKHRLALILVIQEEMEYADAAKILEISEGNLRVNLHRGRKLLKEEMEKML
jgi:RNA polymerase sigma-70 factor (ECF subfamily)